MLPTCRRDLLSTASVCPPTPSWLCPGYQVPQTLSQRTVSELAIPFHSSAMPRILRLRLHVMTQMSSALFTHHQRQASTAGATQILQAHPACRSAHGTIRLNFGAASSQRCAPQPGAWRLPDPHHRHRPRRGQRTCTSRCSRNVLKRQTCPCWTHNQ